MGGKKWGWEWAEKRGRSGDGRRVVGKADKRIRERKGRYEHLSQVRRLMELWTRVGN